MDQQKPRDNSMYHLSDRTNLKQQDKALSTHTSKYGLFGHRMLTRSEVKSSKTVNNRFKQSTQETAISEIWQSFTVPLKFRIPSRKKSKTKMDRPAYTANHSMERRYRSEQQIPLD